jgi:hypothetical protein
MNPSELVPLFVPDFVPDIRGVFRNAKPERARSETAKTGNLFRKSVLFRIFLQLYGFHTQRTHLGTISPYTVS